MVSDIVRFVAEAGRSAPSADNSQPWQFHWDGEHFAVSWRPSTGEELFVADSHATLLSVGAVLENIDQALDAVAGREQWMLTMPFRPHVPYARIRLGDMPCRLPVTQPSLFERHTNRLRFAKSPLPDRLLAALADSRVGAARLCILTADHQKGALAEATRYCSEARFLNRQLHEWLARSLRFGAREVDSGDGLDVTTLGLPPGGQTLFRLVSDWKTMTTLNKVGLYKLFAAVDSTPLAHAPAIVCVVAPDSPSDTINAGRLLERTWIRLNAEGYAVHPNYVIPDQIIRLRERTLPPQLEERVQLAATSISSHFGLEQHEKMQMVLRVGKPLYRPARSRRLSLERLFSTKPAATYHR